MLKIKCKRSSFSYQKAYSTTASLVAPVVTNENCCECRFTGCLIFRKNTMSWYHKAFSSWDDDIQRTRKISKEIRPTSLDGVNQSFRDENPQSSQTLSISFSRNTTFTIQRSAMSPAQLKLFSRVAPINTTTAFDRGANTVNYRFFTCEYIYYKSQRWEYIMMN